jgi:hypothetical protein
MSDQNQPESALDKERSEVLQQWEDLLQTEIQALARRGLNP